LNDPGLCISIFFNILIFFEQYAENEKPKISTGYFQVPDLVFDLPLTANEKLLLIYFMRRADKSGKSFPSVKRICRDCGIKSANTVRKATKGLEKAGLVRKIEHTVRPHYYIVAREFYEVIQAAKEKYFGNGNGGDAKEVNNKTSQLKYMLGQISSPTPSEYDHPCTDNDPPPDQNLTPKEYTYKEHTTKVDTENTKTRKKRVEEAGASSSPVGEDSKVTLSDVVEYMSNLTPEEKREFDQEACKLSKPGEPDPEKSLWQKRLLRVRYLERVRG